MYLKAIKAQGFKSFAEPIHIELESGITGIVGPNGSGKSNVVDAIRWVLGEQSVKSLRGEGNMTDVIFSGSKSRNPLNVASVTLILDNTDHAIPVAYDSISIKRRVYRDGTNEYYLNGEKCRLKDITDLLLDSGIAKESFNIISQGKIEEILSNKPSDRRVIFEEAANVLKYKKRKEEALHKLDKTHDNMSRVEDIIKELENQVVPLKEQRDKALAYLEVKEQLEKIEIASMTYDITKIHDRYETSKQKMRQLQEELLSISSYHSQNTATMESYKLQISKIEEKLVKKQQELLDYTTEVAHIQSQKQMAIERQQYQVEDTKLHSHLIELKEEHLRLENEIHQLENTILEQQKEINKWDQQILNQKKDISVQKQSKVALEQQLTTLWKKETTLKNKKEGLEQNIESNASLPYSVKCILNQKTLNGIHHTIGNSIEIEEQYVMAITTALGASMSYLIVETETDAKAAIQYLKDHKLGRATFFPMSVIQPKSIDIDTKKRVSGMNGFIDIASNLVQYQKQYESIIQNQLGNVLVVRTMDDAILISKQIGHRYRIVTLEGELLHVGGSLTGGNSHVKNAISEKYELEKTIQELKTVVDTIQTNENRMNELDHQLASLEDKLYLLQHEKTNLEISLESIQKQKASCVLKKDVVFQEIQGTTHLLEDTVSKEEEEILKLYYEAVKKKEETEQILESLKKEKENLQDTLDEFEQNEKLKNTEYNQKNKEKMALEIDINRMDVKLDTLLTSLNETYGMTYENAVMIYHLDMEEEQAHAQIVALKQKKKELGEVNTLAPAEYEKVRTRYEFLLAQRDDLVKAEDTLLEIIHEMDGVMEKEFMKTFQLIQENFAITFKELFKGGRAELKLTDPNHLLETGVEIIASPPGKKLTSISLLSGGEKTFTAISLLFAIIKSRPAPFCILDEVEAALDEVNVDSFGSYLCTLKDQTQFILITHKKKTMEYADCLYGITMQESGVSKLVSVKLEQIVE